VRTEALEQRTPRWFQRVLPVTGLVVAVAAVLAVVFPGFREQVARSATHEPQEYVALSFGRAADGTVVTCTGSRTAVKVRFDVESHLAGSEEIAYEIRVGDTRREGTVSVAPGGTAEVVRAVRRPGQGRFEVSVLLPDQDQRVVAYCPSGAS
jgi:hypothetical protein